MMHIHSLLLGLVIFTTFGRCASADDFKYGSEEFKDIYLTETNSMYYLQFPETGDVLTRKKDPVIAIQLVKSPELERQDLRQRFRVKFDARMAARRAAEEAEAERKEAEQAEKRERIRIENEEKRRIEEAQRRALESQMAQEPVIESPAVKVAPTSAWPTAPSPSNASQLGAETIIDDHGNSISRKEAEQILDQFRKRIENESNPLEKAYLEGFEEALLEEAKKYGIDR